ncbi:MAG TPA: hypothetical protein VGR62_12255 [Candidatus Binatia bacterium]|jgi:hypothetical protein|nr:hypothetical protein [Candidatus Binatia bacterium]
MARAVLVALLLAATAHAADRPTFSVDYVVRIASGDPGRAHIRWELAGIDEIARFRLVFRDGRAADVQGTGRLDWQGRTLEWTPGGPYAHLEYTITIDKHRPTGGPRYDSHAEPTWVATRARHLFPQINVHFRPGAEAARARARLLFRLPKGWKSVATGELIGSHAFVVEEPGKRLARPRGWFLLGDVDTTTRRIAGMEITVAAAPGSGLDVPRLFRFYEQTIPLLAPLLGSPPARLLVVSAPDPMWRGGISGEGSFYVNGRIAVRSRDRTSTYLHELIHVWQPFRPEGDGRWISEGLAEYYSLVIQRRAGMLSAAGFARGIELFARHGRWDIDLSRTHDAAALNNSAPLVLHWLDTEIARATDGAKSLDDAVRRLAADSRELTTASFLRAVNRTAGKDFTPWFRRYVFRGRRPPVTDEPVAGLPGPASVRYRPQAPVRRRRPQCPT